MTVVGELVKRVKCVYYTWYVLNKRLPFCHNTFPEKGVTNNIITTNKQKQGMPDFKI